MWRLIRKNHRRVMIQNHIIISRHAQYFIVLIYVELNNSWCNVKDTTLYDNMPQLFMDAPKIGKDPSSDLS